MRLTERKTNPAVTAMMARALNVPEMERANGGHDLKEEYCPASPKGIHNWHFTGETRPGMIFRDLWPDYLHECAFCHETRWMWNK